MDDEAAGTLTNDEIETVWTAERAGADSPRARTDDGDDGDDTGDDTGDVSDTSDTGDDTSDTGAA
jgi:hypothetical protein